jgi:dienelactone hydrolase
VKDDARVTFRSSDGWELGGLLRLPGEPGPPGVVLVPGSLHERDSFTTTADALEERGIASLRFDLRGRGTSRGSLAFSRMAPGQRRRVRADVAAAVDELVSAGADSSRVGLVAEQDTAADAVLGALDGGAAAVVAISATSVERAVAALAARPVPVHGLVSAEDREAVRGTVDLFLAGRPGAGRLDVLHHLGRGATMFHLRAGQPGAPPLEALIGDWLAATLA